MNADDSDNADFYFIESKMVANYEKEFYAYQPAILPLTIIISHKDTKNTKFFIAFVFFVSLWEITIISFYDLYRYVYKIHRL